MRNDSFKDFVLEQLVELRDVSARSMFGSYGLYFESYFFAIVSDCRLYFKTDVKTSHKYIKEGMAPFKPSEKQILKNYYEVPPDVIEDKKRLALWARDSINLWL